MFAHPNHSAHQEISALELAELLQAGKALVVDVREVDEFAKAHIPGSLNLPLSQFDVADLPDPEGKQLVLSCAGGKRSAMALDKCAVANNVVDTHLAGGLAAWVQAGLPVD